MPFPKYPISVPKNMIKTEPLSVMPKALGYQD